jgi:CDP-diacylglycerol--serine O-phosphatidyltransferase
MINRIVRRKDLKNKPKIHIPTENIQILENARIFYDAVLSYIEKSRKRIYMSALYLQDDEAGRNVLTALFKAKEKNKELDIKVFVDFHRAQRGLIGEKNNKGNIVFYNEFKKNFTSDIEIYGVPVKKKELFGVLHLKGFTFDDTYIYSGASLNNVYLNHFEKYRLDRYFIIKNKKLADSTVAYLEEYLLSNSAVSLFEDGNGIATKDIKKDIVKLKKSLSKAEYNYDGDCKDSTEPKDNEVALTLLSGFGKKNNELNDTIIALLKNSSNNITIYTPYLNFPKKILKEIKSLIKRKVSLNLVVADKEANDFYTPPGKGFQKIDALPYIYEQNLRNFAKKFDKSIKDGLLNIFIWRDKDNTFHLKGLESDNKYYLLTGSNLNPRAWNLDLENGMLIYDEKEILFESFKKESDSIKNNSYKITDFSEVPEIKDYPKEVRKIVSRLKNTKFDYFIKKLI